MIGGSLEYTPLRYVTISMEVGAVATWGDERARIAVIPRVRLPLGRAAFAIGVGGSLAPWSEADCSSLSIGFICIDPTYRSTYDALWLNAEMSLERRWPSGVIKRR